MASGTIKAAVVGSSGYAGGELMRVLLRHPHVTVTAVTSERSAGQPIVTLFPHLSGLTDLLCEHFEPEAIAEKADLVFLALPHMASMAAAQQLHASGRRVIDRASYSSWVYADGRSLPAQGGPGGPAISCSIHTRKP